MIVCRSCIMLTVWYHVFQQEFEAGTADNFASFPQQNGMLTCYNLLFVSPQYICPSAHSLRCLRHHEVATL